MKLSDMNRINDLIEKGFVQTQSGRQISLHPMIQEVAIDETRPSVNNSAVLLDSLQTICLLHGHDVTWYKPLFLTIENIIREIADDNTPAYLSFLEDVFPYMEKYHYTAGMELIIGKLSGLLTDETVGRSTDRAVLLDYRAACEEKTEKAIKLEKEAIALKMLTLFPISTPIWAGFTKRQGNGIWHSRLWSRGFGSWNSMICFTTMTALPRLRTMPFSLLKWGSRKKGSPL